MNIFVLELSIFQAVYRHEALDKIQQDCGQKKHFYKKMSALQFRSIFRAEKGIAKVKCNFSGNFVSKPLK